MSSASERTLKLMAYADGELAGEELAEVEAWLRRDARAVRVANAFAELGDIVTLGHEGSKEAAAVASFDIADAVMSAVAKEAPAKVVPLSRKRSNRFVYGAVAGALALASAFALTMRPKGDQPMARVTAPAEPSSGTGVDVDVNETPGHSVSVFYVPSETNLTTSVVVWVDETGEK
jgi:anti-sigma factor RsiW